MSDQKRSAYAAFERWELDLARGKAKTLVGRYGFTWEDQGDLEQELLLHLLKKRKARQAWAEVRASERTVMDRILTNKARDLIKGAKRGKNKVIRASVPLGEEVAA
ncbi:MAG: hypothetical protein HY548_07350, partial [Elusimicrobia bacterium]|nr:hypothetical protein [Elusimicrobiota bacterium]